MQTGSGAEIDELVETYASDEPAILQRDFRNSLHLAFTPAERYSYKKAEADSPASEIYDCITRQLLSSF